MNNWFNRGQEALKEQAGKLNLNPFVFWMESGQTKTIKFCDGDDREKEPFVFKEHYIPSLDVGERTQTCSGEDCVWCGKKYNSQTKGAFTIIDRTERADKDGNKVKDVKKLYKITQKELSNLFARMERFKVEKLTECDVDITRTGQKVKTTYTFDFLKDSEKLPEGIDVTPFDYTKVLQPKTKEEALILLKSIGVGEEESDIPF